MGDSKWEIATRSQTCSSRVIHTAMGDSKWEIATRSQTWRLPRAAKPGGHEEIIDAG